ncbi:Retrotransposon protein, Ty3-gypsy subclass [Gossypium australe]|uniref:Retrotransposon protein, Ty3-gypsy subclass n=1 Tax=Gossypium australe TaxID=47621 RepID=A0A5B6VMU1_9ROSI|nr:Retrotransposon protein, Ty3-gypsy subclass [Gossypium australe]
MGVDHDGFCFRFTIDSIFWGDSELVTKCAHSLPVHTTFSLQQLAELYIKNIVRLHGVLFMSRFWKTLHEALGLKLHFSTTYHAQSDGQFERVI